MGKSAEQLAKAHGTTEMVALFDAVMYRDPEDVETDPKEYRYQRATYGERFTVDSHRAKELAELGAATPEVSGERARLAMAGVRQPESIAAPPTATAMLSPQSEQVRALQSATSPSGNPDDLARLTVEELKRLAVAFAIPVESSDSKEKLVEKIAKTASSTPEDVDESRRLRDEAHARARAEETARQSGGNVEVPDESLFDRGGAGDGAEAEEPKAEARKEPVDDLNATDGARSLAAERNIDLHAVSGSGDNGRIIKPDVEKYLESLDASQGKS